jgi:prepilin-type N-terminal cleavage/methylation domain-containing protein
MNAVLTSSPRRIKGQNAFTMVELLVGTAIFGLLMVGVFGVMTMGLSITQMSRENLRATEIMLDKMEGVRLYSWTQVNDSTFLQSSFTNWFFETNNIGTATAVGNGIQYTGTVSVAASPFTNSYSANIRSVTVTVNWASGGIARSRTMATFVSQPGMQNYVFNN